MSLTEPIPQEHAGKTPEERRPVQLATEGWGPFIQRDYVAVVEGSPCSPDEVARRIRTEFPRFSPEDLAAFSRPEGETGPLQVGDTMHVLIRGSGHCSVVATHVTDRSLTLRTQQGHMEAGRITFGAYRDAAGRLVCRIRSRSRIGDPARLIAYWTFGIHAQARIWVSFLERLAESCGGRTAGQVVVSTDRIRETPADRGECEAPTFTA